MSERKQNSNGVALMVTDVYYRWPALRNPFQYSGWREFYFSRRNIRASLRNVLYEEK